jgi:phenylacetate-CoA ligase
MGNSLCTPEQFVKLREHVEYAYANAPFYRSRFDSAGVKPSVLNVYSDLIKLPTVTKTEVIDAQLALPPFGGQRAEAAGDLARIYCNAGSLLLWFNQPDLDHMGQMFGDLMGIMGVRRGDIVDISSTFHWVLAGTTMDQALRLLGATVVPGGPGMSDLRLKMMKRLGVTAAELFTPYAEELATKFAANDIDVKRDLKIRLLMVGGELRDSGAMDRLREAWGGAAIREFYGVSEAGMLAAECGEGSGMHISPYCVVEVIDPDTGAQLPEGHPGEIVVTEIYRTAQPYVRYRSGDITEGFTTEPCPCGRTTPRLRRILGRHSDIARVKGQFISPALVEQLVRKRVSAGAWQAVIDRPGNIDTMLLRVESEGSAEQRTELEAILQKDVKATLAITVAVEAVAAGTIGEGGPFLDRRRFK